MAYIVTLSAGPALTTIADDTVNTTSTSLSLVGKNYAGYGIFLNENFVQLLENFSNSIPPNAPLTGQLWYDSSNTLLKFYTGTAWKPIHTSAASSTAPNNPVTGDLWWNTLTSQLNVRGASDWIVVGPSFTATAGTSGAITETILDTSLLSHVVVMLYISNSVVGILSKDATFTPQTAISGFPTINPGLNLVSSTVLTNSRFWGNATNAFSVNNISSTSFLRSDQDATNVDKKLTVGRLQVTDQLLIDPTSTEVQIYTNGTGVIKDLSLYVNRGNTQTVGLTISGATAGTQLFGNLTTTNVNPASDNITVIGSGTTRYANIHSVSFSGTNFYTSTIINSGTSGVGNIGSASKPFNVVHARATSAQYADVAERFEADTHLLPGTVVEIGGVKEITQAVQELSESVFGVISTLPGFLLNGSAGTDVTHPAVAVNGRVPVRAVGKIKKGDRLVSAGRGLARAARRDELTAFNVIGRALEDKLTDDEALVEAIVKLNS
jgi:hypothetical protein